MYHRTRLVNGRSDMVACNLLFFRRAQIGLLCDGNGTADALNNLYRVFSHRRTRGDVPRS